MHIDYLNTNGFPTPVLFAIVLGFRLCCIMIDSLHTVDQGIASHIIGSAFWYVAVIRNKLGGNTRAVKISNLNRRLKAHYKSRSHEKRVGCKVI